MYVILIIQIQILIFMCYAYYQAFVTVFTVSQVEFHIFTGLVLVAKMFFVVPILSQSHSYLIL